MVQDVNEQKEIEKQLVISAIQVLRQTGGEINPHTVATTAKIPRSTIYRNAELMDLIAHEEQSCREHPDLRYQSRRRSQSPRA